MFEKRPSAGTLASTPRICTRTWSRGGFDRLQRCRQLFRPSLRGLQPRRNTSFRARSPVLSAILGGRSRGMWKIDVEPAVSTVYLPASGSPTGRCLCQSCSLSGREPARPGPGRSARGAQSPLNTLELSAAAERGSDRAERGGAFSGERVVRVLGRSERLDALRFAREWHQLAFSTTTTPRRAPHSSDITRSVCVVRLCRRYAGNRH